MYFLSLGEKGLSMLVLYLVVFELVSERVKCLRIVFKLIHSVRNLAFHSLLR